MRNAESQMTTDRLKHSSNSQRDCVNFSQKLYVRRKKRLKRGNALPKATEGRLGQSVIERARTYEYIFQKARKRDYDFQFATSQQAHESLSFVSAPRNR
mmetsp:Transcript_42068/g.127612  ORF Transcript_42068/g.127612 Transcript_42068/m.127612 type:complete len:99 (-) Transcript_42068:1869-2165(-)